MHLEANQDKEISSELEGCGGWLFLYSRENPKTEGYTDVLWSQRCPQNLLAMLLGLHLARSTLVEPIPAG